LSSAISGVHSRLIRGGSDRLGVEDGTIRRSVREQIQRNLRYRYGRFCAHYPFLEFGLYTQQLNRYLESFGRNVWVGFHEDFKNQPPETYRNICQFLGVDVRFSPVMDHRHLEAQVPRLSAIGWLQRSGFWQAAVRVAPSGLRPVCARSSAGRLSTGQEQLAWIL
jgi:hypothetical protein